MFIRGKGVYFFKPSVPAGGFFTVLLFMPPFLRFPYLSVKLHDPLTFKIVFSVSVPEIVVCIMLRLPAADILRAVRYVISTDRHSLSEDLSPEQFRYFPLFLYPVVLLMPVSSSICTSVNCFDCRACHVSIVMF